MPEVVMSIIIKIKRVKNIRKGSYESKSFEGN
jgi:hypothetical protein